MRRYFSCACPEQKLCPLSPSRTRRFFQDDKGTNTKYTHAKGQCPSNTQEAHDSPHSLASSTTHAQGPQPRDIVTYMVLPADDLPEGGVGRALEVGRTYECVHPSCPCHPPHTYTYTRTQHWYGLHALRSERHLYTADPTIK